jgi:hypothetical protein
LVATKLNEKKNPEPDGGAEFYELAAGLPGEEMIRKGIQDLGNSVESNESLLVQIGWPRLNLLGAPIKQSWRNIDSDRQLYARLCQTHGYEAHSQYNSLVRQLSSFARALENRHSARERITPENKKAAG